MDRNAINLEAAAMLIDLRRRFDESTTGYIVSKMLSLFVAYMADGDQDRALAMLADLESHHRDITIATLNAVDTIEAMLMRDGKPTH